MVLYQLSYDPIPSGANVGVPEKLSKHFPARAHAGAQFLGDVLPKSTESFRSEGRATRAPNFLENVEKI